MKINIIDPASFGKTTLGLRLLAQAQKQGLAVIFMDVEHTLDPAYMRQLGLAQPRIDMKEGAEE